MSEKAADRLTRLLALVGYLAEHPGVPVTDVATHFGVSQEQVLADVNLLWVSGTPGGLHGDMIDFAADEYDEHVLTLTEPLGMDRPLRLGAHEALALLVALRSLESVAGAGALDTGLVAGTATKLRHAAGQAVADAETLEVHVADEGPALATARRAIGEQRRLHLRYVSAADEVSERDVDPIEVVWDGARWYLQAWCHRVDALRYFRLDRVLELYALEQAVAHRAESIRGSAEPDLAAADTIAELDLDSRARWVAEQYPVESVTDLPDGGLRLRLRVADRAWLANLVLGLGDQVRALRPAALAAQISAPARAALAAYDALSSPS